MNIEMLIYRVEKVRDPVMLFRMKEEILKQLRRVPHETDNLPRELPTSNSRSGGRARSKIKINENK